MKKIVAIKTDGDNLIGLGHIYRTFEIAKKLKKNNIEVIFLTKSIILKKIINKKFKILKINDSDELKTILEKIHPNLIILDKLIEKSNVLKILNKSTNIIAIDYIGKNKKLIKNGLNILYPKSAIHSKNSFSGLEFSIINGSILKSNPKKISKNVKNILIIQGGSDTNCNIPWLIELFNNIDLKFNLNIILGATFECEKKMNSTIKKSKNQIKIFQNVKNIGSIMKKNDIAISGGGITSLELCHLGIPTLILCGAYFENETASLLEKNGFGVNLGIKKNKSKITFIKKIMELIEDFEKRKKMNKIGPGLIDGDGINRTTKIILEMIK